MSKDGRMELHKQIKGGRTIHGGINKLSEVSKCIWCESSMSCTFKYLVLVNKERCKRVSLEYLEYTA